MQTLQPVSMSEALRFALSRGELCEAVTPSAIRSRDRADAIVREQSLPTLLVQEADTYIVLNLVQREVPE